MLHGPVMLDLAASQISPQERDLLTHPATGGVILFTRNFVSPQQLHRLIAEIHELRSPHLLIAVDQEGGRVQRFRDGFTRLPPAAKILQAAAGDIDLARRHARELGWLMAAELRAVGVDFSFAPVLDIDRGVSGVIGDRAFADSPEVIARLAQSWMLGARDAGMISVGKHFPGHGAVSVDSHLDLPIDPRSLEDILAEDVHPFRRLIENGLEGIMPAHVIYTACDAQPAGFSHFWLQQILRQHLGFNGVIFSDDLSMAAAAHAGDYRQRAQAALKAGCDMVLVCNNPAAAREVLDALADYRDPVAQSRMARLHGRPASSLTRLHESTRWTDAVALAGELETSASLALNI